MLIHQFSGKYSPVGDLLLTDLFICSAFGSFNCKRKNCFL